MTKVSRVFYTNLNVIQYPLTVKLVRVFSSLFNYFASARRIQFRWDCTRDSIWVVTPFMQVTN